MTGLLLIAIEAALEAGKAILEVYGNERFEIELKEDRSPLTLADKRSNDIILNHLEKTGIPVLSEESLQQPWQKRKTWQCCWIVDPLDGTKEFIKRNDEFTVNIALSQNGRLLMGVIFAPATGEFYFGSSENGAYKVTVTPAEMESIHSKELISFAVKIPAKEKSDRKFTIVASRSHLNQETENYIAELKLLHPELTSVSRGSSLKLCMIAEGKADVYPRFAPTMEWDTAAGQAIAEAAGCRIYNAQTGNPMIYNKEDLHNPWFVVERIFQTS